MIALTGCSTQKNTGVSRAFHQTKTYYNIYYNGRLSYDEGIQQLDKANKDDFAGVLNLYPVSNHQAAQSTASKMDVAIEKCRKCIKLHSIKAKPQKINYKRKNDPKYKAWLEQKEFNNKMYLAWMMLGQSEFHKGDFLGSVGTFNYVARLYENDKDLVALCQIWVARAYGEMDWLYEAEDIMQKVNIDDLKRKHRPFYSAVMADILLKQQRPREALPFVRVGLEGEKRRGYKARFTYVLGQLYQIDRQNGRAKECYKDVLHLNAAPDLEFNARLHYAELEGDTVKTVKALRRQAKLSKNKDRLDRIYGTIGNIFLQKGDTSRAIEYYELAIEKSTQNGMEKAEVLILAGDLYYNRRDYKHASPLYSEAIHIITNTHPDYLRVRKMSEVLDEVVVNEDVVQLQDSLQHLATLSEEEQLAVVNRLIEELREQERQDSIRAAEEERAAEIGDGKAAVNTMNMLGGAQGPAEWYFYNTQLINNGKQEFQKRWGRRPLEDDWRRQSKAMSSSGGLMTQTEKEPEETDELLAESDSIPADSTMTAELPEIEPVTDPHDPAYYLQQIPKTEEDIAESNRQIATALINLISIYRDKVGNQQLSDEAFLDYCRRFPNDTVNLTDLYYMQYLSALRMQNDTLAAQYRDDILRLFPESQQARIVSDPNYFDALRRVAYVQDSLYAATYEAFRQAEFRTVKQNTQWAEDSLSLSPLMPRFLFLNAIAKAKTEGQDAFIAALRDMVSRYPESEAGAMAKDFLALMNQGSEAQKDESAMTGLADKRGAASDEKEQERDSTAAFSPERNEPTYVLLVMPIEHGVNEVSEDTMQTYKMNRLLYEVALFNFTQFLIKDFDLMQLPYLTRTECALQVTGLENMSEAEWYIGLIGNSAELKATFSELQVVALPITETNYRLLNSPFTIEEYREYLAK